MSIAPNKQLSIIMALILVSLFSIGVAYGAGLADMTDHCSQGQMEHGVADDRILFEEVSGEEKYSIASSNCNHADKQSCVLQCAASSSVTPTLIKEFHEIIPQLATFTLALVAALPDPLPKSIHRPPLV